MTYTLNPSPPIDPDEIVMVLVIVGVIMLSFIR